MKRLVQEKAKAIALRKKGYTYNEILKEVPVAKSSLSLWLKDLPLTKAEKESLKKRKDSNISHGRAKLAGILYTQRLNREKQQLQAAKEVFKRCAHEPLFHTGIALYWAEGGKRTNQWQFVNSDHYMQQVMIKWLLQYGEITTKDIRCRLFVHKAYQSDDLLRWWSKELRISTKNFLNTIVKPSVFKARKRLHYKGCLRLEVRSSKALLNKMRFWQKMLVEYYNKQ